MLGSNRTIVGLKVAIYLNKFRSAWEGSNRTIVGLKGQFGRVANHQQQQAAIAPLWD